MILQGKMTEVSVFETDFTKQWILLNKGSGIQALVKADFEKLLNDMDLVDTDDKQFIEERNVMFDIIEHYQNDCVYIYRE